jgi:amino acid adenylation domain-containing protein
MEYLEQFFETTAASFPERAAVDDGGEVTSYEALDQLANRIARQLVEEGVRPNDRVCIFTGKNRHAYAGVLGTLKAGACWVPLSTQFPPARLKELIELTRPSAAVAEAETLVALTDVRDALGLEFPIVALGEGVADAPGVRGAPTLAARPATRPEIADRTPDDLAYVIYTSGSTGLPKGVMVLHRNIARFLDLCPSFFGVPGGVSGGPRFAHVSELTFDPSLFDLFHAWQTGGTVVPLNRRRHRIDVGAFIAENRVNVIFCVPSAIAAIERAGRIGEPGLAALSHILFTGEVLPPRLVGAWRAAHPGARLFNVYGTTETAIISHWYEIPEGIAPDRPVPVGKPLPGVRVMLLDGDRRVREGEVGESVVTGPQISPGYWGDPAATRQRFVRNPLDPALPQTVYRTGDLLRLRADGLYDYVGRTDSQVKVRGHRVELGEVEAALAAHPDVNEAAVIVLKDSADELDSRLAAFATVRRPEASATALRAFLASRLPVYAVPSEVVAAPDALPRTTNGKVDRHQLARRLVAEVTP